MNGQVFFKAALPLIVALGAVMGYYPQPTLDLGALIMAGIGLLGMVGTAYIMSDKVRTLWAWKESQGKRWEEHSEVHSDLKEILAELKQITKDNNARITRLEKQDDAERFRDRGHRG